MAPIKVVASHGKRQGVEAGQQMRGQHNGADQGGCQPRQPWQVRLGQ